jgi:hypothetical protein
MASESLFSVPDQSGSYDQSEQRTVLCAVVSDQSGAMIKSNDASSDVFDVDDQSKKS